MLHLNNRRLSVIVFSLFSAWLLAFPFQGQILYALAASRQVFAEGFITMAIYSHFMGLLLCGFLVKTIKGAKTLMLGSIIICLLASAVFFLPPSGLWLPALIVCSFLSGCFVAAWGFFFQGCTPRNERIKTAADGLIISNLLMILLNMTAIHLTAYTGLTLAMLMLGAAFFFALRLPNNQTRNGSGSAAVSIMKPLGLLCLFIGLLTINSGLMYQVLNPAFVHLEWLVSWYWAVPYVLALYIMRNLPRKSNRTYLLYVAIAMIGFAFIVFMLIDRSALSYVIVNTLMLGACGVYDLFWWSILGEMLDLVKNPARLLGIGLSANVLGVLLGALVGNSITSLEVQSPNSTLLALSIVCLSLVILPPLHRQLTLLLKEHVFLTMVADLPVNEADNLPKNIKGFNQLTERESEIAALLLKGKTYRMISQELRVSENTVKTHVKNIYAKVGVQSRTELMNILLGI